MAERVEVAVTAEGAEKVISLFKEIQNLMVKIEGKKLVIDVATNSANKELSKTKDAIQEIMHMKMDGMDTGNFVDNLGKANKSLLEMKRTLLDIKSNKLSTSLKTDSLDDAADKVTDNLKKAYARILYAEENGVDTSKFYKSASYWEGQAANIQSLKNQYAELADAEYKAAHAFRSFWKDSSNISHLGSQMQSLGNAMQSATGWYTNLISGAFIGAGYNLLNTATQGLSNAFTRYDILKSYPKYMDEFSTANYDAEDSINELNEAVLGLPTGLDEIAESAQRYTLTTGDMKKGTKLAIASNNAFLASMSTESQKYQGMNQLADLMSAGELKSSEWKSIVKAMPKAVEEIGKSLGYKNNDKFTAALYAGKIAAKDFLNALIDVGTEGGSIEKMAEISKTTWSGLYANINNAMARLGSNMLETFDEIFMKATGKNFQSNVAGIIGAIDDMGTSLQKWAKTHPEEILNFFNKIKKFDWEGTLAGTAKAISGIANVLLTLADVFGGETLGWILIMSNVFGKAISVLGGVTRGLAGLIEVNANGGGVTRFIRFLKELSAGGKLSKAITAIGATKIATKLKDIAGLWKTAKGAEKGAEALGEAGTALAGASISWQGVASKAVSFAGIIGIMVALKPAAKAMQTLSKIKVSGDMGQAIVGMVTTITALSTLATAIGLALETPMAAVGAGVGAGLILAISKSIQWFADGMKTLVQAVDSLNNIEVPSLSKVEQIVSAISTLTEGIWNIGSGDSESSNLIDNIPVVGTINSGAKALKAVFQAIKASGVTSLINKIGSTTKTMQKLANLKIDPESFETNVSNVIEAIDVAFREFDGDYEFGDVIMSFVDKWKASNIDEAFNLLKSTVKSVTTIGDTEMPSTEKIGQQIGSVFKIYTSIEEQLKESFGTKGGKGAKDLSRGGVVVTDYSSQLSTIDGMISAVTGMITSLSNAKTTLESTEGLLDKNGNLDTSFLTNACENIFKVFNELTGAEGGTNWFGKLTNLQNKIDDVDFDGKLIPAIDGIKNVVSKLQSIKESVSGGDGKDKGGEGGGDLIPQSIKDAFGDLEGLATDLIKADPATLQSNATALQSAITSIKTVITDLQGMNTGGEGEGDGGGTSLATIAKQLKDALAELNGIGEITIDGTINDQLTGKLEEALKAIKEAIKKITDLGKTYTVNVTIDGSVSYGGFLQSINDAYDTLSSALGKLKNLGGTPTIGDNTSAHTGGYIGSTGAVLYRAKGGTIFKRKGTDTVPAMLTPGEYVMRRRAVNAYGARFMQHLNNLDLGGALRSLSLRTGSNLIPQGMTIYNNRTTNNNNNARVTQNITTNNPNFAFMRANRFVGAL